LDLYLHMLYSIDYWNEISLFLVKKNLHVFVFIFTSTTIFVNGMSTIIILLID
jgi:hypothetical protein